MSQGMEAVGVPHIGPLTSTLMSYTDRDKILLSPQYLVRERRSCSYEGFGNASEKDDCRRDTGVR
jgi:hypothetical protein